MPPSVHDPFLTSHRSDSSHSLLCICAIVLAGFIKRSLSAVIVIATLSRSSNPRSRHHCFGKVVKKDSPIRVTRRIITGFIILNDLRFSLR